MGEQQHLPVLAVQWAAQKVCLQGSQGRRRGLKLGPLRELHCLDSAVKKKKMRQIELVSLVGPWEAQQQGWWQGP